MKILLLNQDWFAEEFRASGHTVITCGPAEHLDIRLEMKPHSTEELLERLPSDFKPDLVVLYDNSLPPIYTGLANLSAKTIFYSVDTFHHGQLHRNFAPLFDGVLVAQKECLAEIKAAAPLAEWLPLWAPRQVEASNQKEYHALFVGNLDRNLNPDRVEFFERLGHEVSLTCLRGEYWKLFPHARVVVNQTVKGDLNFRVFEALSCGSALVTEASGNGLGELFQSGVHLETYKRGDINDAARVIRSLLDQPQRALTIGAAGQRLVREKHSASRRAEALLAYATSIPRRAERNLLASMSGSFFAARYFSKINPAYGRNMLDVVVDEACGAGRRGEPMTQEQSGFAVLAAFQYEAMAPRTKAEAMIANLQQAYPQQPHFHLARIKLLLDYGKRAEAEGVARSVFAGDSTVALQEAVKTVEDLLRRNPW